jgi:hypothetical protein
VTRGHGARASSGKLTIQGERRPARIHPSLYTTTLEREEDLMRKTVSLFLSLAFPVLCVTVLHAQQLLYQDHFTDGSPDIEWTSVWFDDVGNPLTPMDVDFVSGNPSGDGWVGSLSGDLENLGGLGMAWAGDFSLTDYSLKAEVFISLDNNYYDAIVARVDTTGGVVRGYQFAANFYSGMGLAKLKLRLWSSIPDSIVTLDEWSGSEIPGGPPTEDGWHTMEIRVQDDQIKLYWDSQQLPGSPYYDSHLDSGAFAVYTFDFAGQATTLVDDVTVRRGPVPDFHRVPVPAPFHVTPQEAYRESD